MQLDRPDAPAHDGPGPLLRGYPRFRSQLVGYLVSMLGDQVGWIALVWLVLRLTGSASAVGVVTLVYIAPQAFSGPFAGALLDRFGRARVMALANAGVAALLAGVAVVASTVGAHGLWAVYLMVGSAGALVAFNTAGRIALIAELVPPSLRARANFLSQSGGQVAWLLGPAIGGAGVALVGSVPLLAADGATYVILALVLAGIAAEPRPSAAASHMLADVWAGLRYLMGRRELIALALLTVLFNFLYGPFEVLLPALAHATLGGAWALGLLWSAFGVGSLGTTAVLTAWRGRLKPSRAFGAIIVGWALVALAMTRVASEPEAVAVMLAGGVIYSPWSGLYATVVQGMVPQTLRGRVAGAQSSLTVLGMPLGAFLTGLVLGHLESRTLFALSGGLTLAIGVVALASPLLRRLDSASQAFGEA